MPETRDTKPAANNKKQPVPPPPAGPGKRLIFAATLLIFAELAFLAVLLHRQNQVEDIGETIGRLNLAQTRADEIRVAWDELAEEGASFRARVGNAEGGSAEVRRYLEESAQRNRLEIQIKGPAPFDAGKGVDASRFTISGHGPGQGVVAFLLELGKAPALINITKLGISGMADGRASLKLTLYQYRLKPKNLEDLKEFVSMLPAVPPQEKPRTDFRPRRSLFVPRLASREDALRGWPNIFLGGFSENKALMIVNGTPKTFELGETVASGIVYTEKLSVNQAILKRQQDNSEIILTVGSPEYALKPSEVREMSGFTLMLQKRQQASLLKELAGQ